MFDDLVTLPFTSPRHAMSLYLSLTDRFKLPRMHHIATSVPPLPCLFRAGVERTRKNKLLQYFQDDGE